MNLHSLFVVVAYRQERDRSKRFNKDSQCTPGSMDKQHGAVCFEFLKRADAVKSS